MALRKRRSSCSLAVDPLLSAVTGLGAALSAARGATSDDAAVSPGDRSGEAVASLTPLRAIVLTAGRPQ
jgi:hypothetical protein